MCPRPPAVGARWEAVADPGEEVSPQASSTRGQRQGTQRSDPQTGHQASSTSSTPQKTQCVIPKVPIFQRPDHGPQWEDQTPPQVAPPALGPINPVWVRGSFKDSPQLRFAASPEDRHLGPGMSQGPFAKRGTWVPDLASMAASGGGLVTGRSGSQVSHL